MKFRIHELLFLISNSTLEELITTYTLVVVLLIMFFLSCLTVEKTEQRFCKRIPANLFAIHTKWYTKKCLLDLKRELNYKKKHNLIQFKELTSRLQHKNE